MTYLPAGATGRVMPGRHVLQPSAKARVMPWKTGRGLLGPLKPLLGSWLSLPEDQESKMPARCMRVIRSFGAGWIELDARWDMAGGRQYREIALFGAMEEGALGFHSFTSDGKHSQGRKADGSDVHPGALAFEAQMPAGLARMIYWPLEAGDGFYFAVESRGAKGWTRFLRQAFRPDVNHQDARVP